MPELPDVTVYVEALRNRILDRKFVRASSNRLFFFARAEPPSELTYGKSVREIRRVGKRIAIGVENDLWLVYPPNDRRAGFTGITRTQAGQSQHAGCVRVRQRMAMAYGGRQRNVAPP